MKRILVKRILAFVLAVTCMFSVCSCGGNTDKDVAGASSSSGTKIDKSDKNDQTTEESQSEENNAKEVEYKTFDDFTGTERIAAYDIYLDTPVCAMESDYCGFVSHNSQDYAIIVTSSKESNPDLSVENDFADVMNTSFHSCVNNFNHLKCEDYTPETIDTVTLPCGAEAIKFEGIQPADMYGTPKECYVYGYSFVFNDVLLIVSYIIFDDSAVDEATKTEVTDCIDRMVQTVRTTRD